jgi:uncharacterized protein YeeX (DUF496 family)
MKIRKINYNTKRKNPLKAQIASLEKTLADHQKRLAEITLNPYHSNINNK